MSADQAHVMESLGGVLFVSPEKRYELHTTHSPNFLGLRQNTGLWKDSNYGVGTVTGVIDSGITPGHPSFNDNGMLPPPPRWKGKCEMAGCNNKLIGIRNFVSHDSAIDNDGHGTHTSSCSSIAILAAMDTAIEEGVDVLSISLARWTTPSLGPGIEILVAWPKPVVGAKKAFDLDKGTSISCPHLAGIAALLRSTHPDWSPAAIKSAIMTTTSHVSLSGKPIVDERDIPADVFAIGAGHVKASKANGPGLIFYIQPDDYIPYLCGLGYTPKQVQTIVKKTVSGSKTIPEAQLNYPSFVVALKRGESKTYSRTVVTNVGKENSTYTIGDVSLPQGVNIEISTHSQQLSFTAVQKKISYEVTFARDSKDHVKGPWGGGYMTWVSGKYSVKTPFSIMYNWIKQSKVLYLLGCNIYILVFESNTMGMNQ
nr:peptidase S8/S53 domain-containing protein [Tanacetum cinerariifolium]